MSLCEHPAETIEQALKRHGLTWQQLDRLAHAAVQEAKRARNITLDPTIHGADCHEVVHDYFLAKGRKRLLNYNPDLADGCSITTSIYRHMVGEKVKGSTLIDWLRVRFGDNRRGTPIFELTGINIDDTPIFDDPTIEQAAAEVSNDLTTEETWTLNHLGCMLANGIPLLVAARELNLDIATARARLDQLQAALSDKQAA